MTLPYGHIHAHTHTHTHTPTHTHIHTYTHSQPYTDRLIQKHTETHTQTHTHTHKHACINADTLTVMHNHYVHEHQYDFTNIMKSLYATKGIYCYSFTPNYEMQQFYAILSF